MSGVDGPTVWLLARCLTDTGPVERPCPYALVALDGPALAGCRAQLLDDAVGRLGARTVAEGQEAARRAVRWLSDLPAGDPVLKAGARPLTHALDRVLRATPLWLAPRAARPLLSVPRIGGRVCEARGAVAFQRGEPGRLEATEPIPVTVLYAAGFALAAEGADGVDADALACELMAAHPGVVGHVLAEPAGPAPLGGRFGPSVLAPTVAELLGPDVLGRFLAHDAPAVRERALAALGRAGRGRGR